MEACNLNDLCVLKGDWVQSFLTLWQHDFWCLGTYISFAKESGVRRKFRDGKLSLDRYSWFISPVYGRKSTYIYILYLEPEWPPFWGVHLPFYGSNLLKYGSFGFYRYVILRIYIYIYIGVKVIHLHPVPGKGPSGTRGTKPCNLDPFFHRHFLGRRFVPTFQGLNQSGEISDLDETRFPGCRCRGCPEKRWCEYSKTINIDM